MAEDGEYVKVGDIWEWRWHEGKEPKVAVPKGEFDPRAVASEPEPEPKPEPAPKPKATPKTNAKG